MAAPYSQDLRDRILAAYDRDMETAEIADLFQVSVAWARRVNQRRRKFGETTPRKMGGPSKHKFSRERLAELVREQPDATLKELRERLGTECGEPAISMALKAMGLPLKKRQSTLRNRTARTLLSAAPTGVHRRARSTRGAFYL